MGPCPKERIAINYGMLGHFGQNPDKHIEGSVVDLLEQRHDVRPESADIALKSVLISVLISTLRVVNKFKPGYPLCTSKSFFRRNAYSLLKFLGPGKYFLI
jgi:hypothetical protein